MTHATSPSSGAWACLSEANLQHNARTLRCRIGSSQLMAVVKANAYGHDLVDVGRRLAHHVDQLGVARIDEARHLQQARITTPVVILQGPQTPHDVIEAAQHLWQVVLHTPEQVQWLHAVSLPQPLTVWLKADTGMGRLGFTPEQIHTYHRMLSQHPMVRQPVGIMSHMACAHQPSHTLNASQLEAFQHLLSLPAKFSLCNSAALWHHPDHHHHMVRAGLMIYGASPFPHRAADDLGLRPVMTCTACLIAVRPMAAGACVGYNASYRCPRAMTLGVVSMGYGDGYPRLVPPGTCVLIRGMACPVVGDVSMDMMTVDVSSCPEARVGDRVVLWGPDLPVEQVARWAGTTPWALLAGLQHRVTRVWGSPSEPTAP